MKLAISGKGGVGKTTLAALLANLYVEDKKRVLAVDADPDANLGIALGVPQEALSRIVPIAEMGELVQERTGAKPGVMGQFFTLNPKVDDIPEKYWLEHRGIRLLVMGGIKGGGAGCACPENTLLQNLLRHLVVERNETVIVDMEAGLEHMGRGTARAVDAFVVVVEPGRRSFQTAQEIIKLARDLGVRKVYAVANKVKPGQEEEIKSGLGEIPLLGLLPYDETAVEADLQGRPVFEACESLVNAARTVKAQLDSKLTTF